jgi:hypothetical protein
MTSNELDIEDEVVRDVSSLIGPLRPRYMGTRFANRS